MDRSNPYEAAFEAYLAAGGLCYVGVDEKKRSLLGDEPVKNLDFIVLGACGSRLLVDVKGRQFPGGLPGKQRFVWENWSTQADIHGMTRWLQLFGPGYLGLFVFIYRIGPAVTFDEEPADLWNWQGTRYLLRAVPVDDYRRHMRVRSPRWGTVGLPGQTFRELARPFRYYSHELPAAEALALAEAMEMGSFHGPDQDRGLLDITRLDLQTVPGGGPEDGGDWR